MPASPFADLAAFTALARLTGLAVSPDGRRLVVAVAEPDAKGARYVTALWEIPLDASRPRRLTFSEAGESAPAFRPDGSLLFTSARPDPDGRADETALWCLPRSGEATVLARRPGGLDGPVVATGSGAVLVAGSRLMRSSEADDGERRSVRTERRISAVLHDGMPVRYWDHELGDESPRLLLIAADGVEPVDLAPDAVTELMQASYSISADASTVATTWIMRGRGGQRRQAFAVIDVASGQRVVHEPAAGWEYTQPVVSADGGLLAVGWERAGSFETSVAAGVMILPVAGGDPVPVELDDVWPTQWAWSPDSTTLYVSGDLHGRGAVLVVDAATGAIEDYLADDAVYSELCPTTHGVFALRAAMDSAATPVRLRYGRAPQLLATPAPTPELPGTVSEFETDGVHSWLFEPPAAQQPAPVMLWIHGGPFSSWNAWSWRWNPWVAVARGWAVVLPDPALSTGYGQASIDRGWPHLADVVWADAEKALEDALRRPGLDATRTALLGASFGGYMTNWIAGHTARFGAIVTHAGLWALDQQHATTDAADFKTRVFGRLADHPQWYAANSPHHTVEAITTPMLVVHGNRDYRVPVSEALRLWWDLVSHYDGEPNTMPHRFLQLIGENHWVLSPANAEIWYDTVLGFCAQHVLGEPWTPTPLL